MKSQLADVGIPDCAAPPPTPAQKTKKTKKTKKTQPCHHSNAAPAYYLGRPVSFWITRA
jgi:hypothetical protein